MTDAWVPSRGKEVVLSPVFVTASFDSEKMANKMFLFVSIVSLSLLVYTGCCIASSVLRTWGIVHSGWLEGVLASCVHPYRFFANCACFKFVVFIYVSCFA